MEKYRFLEHTADAKFQAFGKTLEEAFQNAALAMFSIMTDTDKVQAKITKDISVDGSDKKSLLVNFLEEFIYLLDTENFLLHGVNALRIIEDKGTYKLEAKAVGDTYSDRYVTQGDVKAITYNDMQISEEKDHIMVQVIVDI